MTFRLTLCMLALLSLPVCAAAPGALAGHGGAYELDDGSTVFVGYLEEIGGLMYVHLPSHRIGGLRQTASGEFVSGPSLGAEEPVEVRAQFENGTLTWSGANGARRGKRRLVRAEEVAFANAGVTLKGTLTIPPGEGPHPAVVLLHGGGAQTRNFVWVAPFFNRLGLAVLAYDKRGAGASTGDWRSASQEDLARDALAAVDLLRRRKDIDASRIGLYGSSNGGWIAPLAATLAPDRIAFVIARSASALAERRNNIYEVETDLLARGFGPEDIAAMRALHERYIAVMEADGRGWEELRREVEAASAKPWFDLARIPRDFPKHSAENEAWIRSWIASERGRLGDPAAVWRRVRCPVLVQIGSADEAVPARESARIIENALRSGGNRKHAVIVYPNGTHNLFESRGERPPDFRPITRFVPGYLTDLERWIAANVNGRPRVPV